MFVLLLIFSFVLCIWDWRFETILFPGRLSAGRWDLFLFCTSNLRGGVRVSVVWPGTQRHAIDVFDIVQYMCVCFNAVFLR